MKHFTTALATLALGFSLCVLGATLNGCQKPNPPPIVLDGFVRIRPAKDLGHGIIRAELWQPKDAVGIGLPVYQRDLGNRGFVRIATLTEQD